MKNIFSTHAICICMFSWNDSDGTVGVLNPSQNRIEVNRDEMGFVDYLEQPLWFSPNDRFS